MAVSGSGVEKNALNQSANAQGTAASALGTINPIYSQLATGTVGYTPQQKADLLTAGGESVGGSTAGAVGQGGLYAARTGNAGGAMQAIDDAARNGQVQSSDNALKVNTDSDALATANQRVGLSGLNSIYDDANRTGSDYLSTANSSQQAAAANKLKWTTLGLNAVGALA